MPKVHLAFALPCASPQNGRIPEIERLPDAARDGVAINDGAPGNILDRHPADRQDDDFIVISPPRRFTGNDTTKILEIVFFHPATGN